MSDIIRRDPRAERIARNRLHPLHGSISEATQQTQTKWMGPNGLVRKNPHAVGFVGPNGIRRIDRSGAQQTGSSRRSASSETNPLPLHRIAEPAHYICVVPDMVGGRLSSHDKDLLGLARQLAGDQGAVLAIVFGEHKENGFDLSGIDRLLHLQSREYEGYAPEQRTQALTAVDRQFVPRHWLLPDGRGAGAELGRRLGATLGVRPATRVWQLNGDHCVSRAGAGREDLQRPLSRLILAAAECAEPVSETRHEALPVSLETGAALSLPRMEDLGPVAVDPALVPMAEAEFILSGGNGVRDWTLFHHAAGVLGATEGASRVAVDDGHMPRNRQVGATGTWVTARVYLAVGISGAIQHLQGIGACDKVIAINQDSGCDMIKRADLSVIGDSSAILQALVSLIEAYRKGDVQNAA